MFGNTPSWISQQVAPPPGQQRPMSFWDLQGKAIKTEQEILEEQRLSEERRLEELRSVTITL
ncbi:unnamed protein product [Timema podura]|nr:unnamed protein product [Timema podura]